VPLAPRKFAAAGRLGYDVRAMSSLRFPLLAATLSTLVLAGGEARADDTIKTPDDHPHYKLEIEPHLLFGWDNHYASNGYGLGVRFSVPIVENGFVPSINNSVAIGFGVDFLHYDYCFWRGFNCSANALAFPVVMQWNFFVAQKWSVFGEPGLFFWKGFYDNPCDGNPACGPVNSPSAFYVAPALYVGGRYYFSEHIALTMRVGWPTLSIGASFM